MSKISLKHSGGNVVSLNSPTSAPTSADVAFKLPIADGTNGQVLKTDGSGNLSFGADTGGKILQVIQTVKTDTASLGSVDTFTDISGMSVTITPSSSSSKVLVTVVMNVSGGDNQAVAWRLLRGSTPIYIGDADGNRIRVAASVRVATNGDAEMVNCSAVFLDSPNTTSATTYKIDWARPFASSQIYLNRPSEDYDNNDRARAPSSILVQEVAA